MAASGALALLAVAMLRNSLAFVARPLDPALAVALDPGNSESLADRAEQLLRSDSSARGQRQADALARRALERSPISAVGARMLATTRDMAGDSIGARRLIAYAESLSRRDLPTEMWFIEDAVQHNEISKALHHYDIALRGSDATRPLLFAVLNKALAQTEVVDNLVPILTARPLWAEPFLQQAVQRATDLGGLTTLLVALGRLHYPLSPVTVAVASGRIANAHQFDAAWQVYKAGHPEAIRESIRDPGFGQVNEYGAPFEWALTRDNAFSAQPGALGRLAYNAMSDAGGVVARQMLLMRPGPLFLSGRSFSLGPAQGDVRVRLTCVDGDEIGIVHVPTGERFSGAFTVPARCPAQWLEILVDAADRPAGAAGELGELRLSTANLASSMAPDH